MLVVKRFALLAVAPHRVVLTLITHPSADVASGQVDRHVEVARAGMFVAVTFCETRPTAGKAFSIYLPGEDGVGGKEARFGNWGRSSGEMAINKKALAVKRTHLLTTSV